MNPVAIVKWLWDNKALIGFVVALGAVGFMVHRADLKAQEQREISAQLDEVKDTIDDMRAWHDKTIASLERKTHEDQNRTDFSLQAATQNQADRIAGDGPLAPVLRNGLSGLGRRQAERNARNPR